MLGTSGKLRVRIGTKHMRNITARSLKYRQTKREKSVNKIAMETADERNEGRVSGQGKMEGHFEMRSKRKEEHE